MEKLENKKYSVLLFLTGFFGIILGNILARNYYWIDGYFYPVEYLYGSYNVKFENVKGIDFGFFVIGLKGLSSLLVIIIACSVYLFLYKTDEEIREYLIEIKKRVESKKILVVISNKMNNIPASLGLKTPTTQTIITDYIKSEESIKYNKIMDAKSNAAIYGVVIGAIQIGIYVMSRNLYLEDSTKIIFNFSVSIILSFFSAYKCNELSEFNKGSSNMWFLFAIILPSVTLIIAGMNFSIKKEWENYNYLVSKTSEQKSSYKPIVKYIIYIIIVLISVAILYYKNSESSANQFVDYAPELIDSVNINPGVIDTNTAVAPDTSIVNDINRELLKRKNALLKEDSIAAVKSKEDSVAKVNAIVKLHKSLLNFK